MKRLIVSVLLFSIFALCFNIAFAQEVEKYWERACGVVDTADDVRNMAVWESGGILATINRQAASDAIKLYNATSGLREEITEQLDMTGIPAGTYAVCAGDFSEDGAFFACSLSYTTGVNLVVYYWANTAAAPVAILNSPYYGYRLGDALDVTGRVSDNTVSILISGNSATSQPLAITYPGSVWTAVSLTNIVQAQDIDQVSGGQFYATYSGGDIVRYNADGSVNATVVAGAATQTSIAVDETRNLIYSAGYYSSATATFTNHLKVYDEASGALLADLSSDPIDVFSFTGTANGSSAVEIVEYPGGTYIYAMSERMGCSRYSYSTVITVASSGGDFTTVQGAISSYCAGGSNAGATQPLVIDIDSASGPYDESISLNQANTGLGDIVGDLVLKGTGASKAVVKLQQGDSDDGLSIFQNTANIILKDLVLCPSQSGTVLVDDLLSMNESSSNTSMNWFEFYGCIITDIDTSGDPMISTAADALNAPPASRGSSMVDGDSLFRTTAAYSLSYFLEQSVVYYNPHLTYCMLGGTSDAQFRMHNSIVAQSRPAGIYGVSADNQHQFIITGDDQKDGILSGDVINCSAIYEFNRRLFYYGAAWDSRGTSANIKLIMKNTIIHTSQDNAASCAINTVDGGLGANTDIYKLHDVIFNVTGNSVIRDAFANSAPYTTDIQRCTFGDADNQSIYMGSNSTGTTISITDSIFSSVSGAAIESGCATALTVNLTNCGLPNTGPSAIGSVTAESGSGVPVTLNETNSVYGDPVYSSTDSLLGTFYDVTGTPYSGSGTSGDLCGGADYIGLAVEGWNLY